MPSPNIFQGTYADAFITPNVESNRPIIALRSRFLLDDDLQRRKSAAESDEKVNARLCI